MFSRNLFLLRKCGYTINSSFAGLVRQTNEKNAIDFILESNKNARNVFFFARCIIAFNRV